MASSGTAIPEQSVPMRSGRPEVHHLIVGARVGQSFNNVEWVDDMASRDGEDGRDWTGGGWFGPKRL